MIIGGQDVPDRGHVVRPQAKRRKHIRGDRLHRRQRQFFVQRRRLAVRRSVEVERAQRAPGPRQGTVDRCEMAPDQVDDINFQHFPQSSKIVLVQDNLSTHKPASLYEAFPAEEARRLVERFEWDYTPKHGSRLDMAECELSVLSSQCLDRRIPDKERLIKEVAAWRNDRNKKHAKADWQFTTADARVKLKRLYPTL
jgi:hypothetical protein